MKRPERSTYTPIDFADWQESGTLEISPRFQRRSVWSRAARSYLIDTLILGYPVPPIYLRIVDRKDGRLVREVVDGQQRVSALLDFMEDRYSLSNNIQSDFGGKFFSDLPKSVRGDITHYPFICEVFYGLTDEEVLSIFARLNTFSVKLNAQELRNGRFFGPFKQSAYGLSLEHLNFWRHNRVFSETSIARMQEVELTSELMVAELDGLQDKKKSIDTFYRRYDEKFPQRDEVEGKFRDVFDAISAAFPETLQQHEFRRVPLFYTLFTAVAHRMFGLPKQVLPRGRTGPMKRVELERLSDAVRELSSVIEDARADESVPDDLIGFVTASLRQTDNLKPRQTRFETLYERAFA